MAAVISLPPFFLFEQSHSHLNCHSMALFSDTKQHVIYKAMTQLPGKTPASN
tara:strand:+ start:3226 stop:3381 length:156 start_codon:yes stop_codon:yes gene_type:complete